jgi:hypothetical protein
VRRSEFLRRGKFGTVTEMERLAELAEEAGARFDPEEEPMPERLDLQGYLLADPKTNRVIAVVQRGDGDESSNYRDAQEAVRRWNAWQDLRALANCLGDDGPAQHLLSPEDARRRRLLLAILDGREGE